jgi:hypothetical protein
MFFLQSYNFKTIVCPYIHLSVLRILRWRARSLTCPEGPYGCETSRLPHFLEVDSRWRWGCQPYTPAAFYTQEDCWIKPSYSFLNWWGRPCFPQTRLYPATKTHCVLISLWPILFALQYRLDWYEWLLPRFWTHAATCCGEVRPVSLYKN